MHQVTYRLRRGYSLDWASKNPRLLAGEPGFETDTGRYKLGNGIELWNDLPYFINQDEIAALISEMEGGGGTALTDHINSETPHPVYDDGPSLILLYENAKV
jgi:hypothetical protein